MTPENTLTPSRRKDACSLLLLLLAGCLVFWRCRFGFGNIDESFYLTIPYRLLQGDALFQEEWHLSQMAGVLTMPFVAGYLTLHGSTEGIILAMRYVCTAIQFCTAVFLYIRMRRVSWLGATAAAVCFLLYTPFGIMALSYNSMGILFLTASLVILLTAQRWKNAQYVLAGFLFAAAVLCCPYLLLVYAVYIGTVVIRRIALGSKIRSTDDSVWSIRTALFCTAGAASAAVLFAVFVLSRGSLEQIVQAFPPMLNDPEHLPSPRFEKTRTYFQSIYHANQYTPHLYHYLAALWFVCLVDRQRKKRKIFYALAASAGVIGLMLSHYFVSRYLNLVMWSVNVLAFFIVLLSDHPQIRRLFTGLCVPGLLYSYCLHLSSNQRFYAISSASAVATVGTLVILALFLEELAREAKFPRLGKLAAGVLCGILAIQVTTQGLIRYDFSFWDKHITELTMPITDGIEKGLITSPGLYADYDARQDFLAQLEYAEDQNVLFLSRQTWYYLETETRMSAYSAWLSGVNEHTLDRLEIYYAINPHKLPDIVLADPEFTEIAEAFAHRFSYHITDLEQGCMLTPE